MSAYDRVDHGYAGAEAELKECCAVWKIQHGRCELDTESRLLVEVFWSNAVPGLHELAGCCHNRQYGCLNGIKFDVSAIVLQRNL